MLKCKSNKNNTKPTCKQLQNTEEMKEDPNKYILNVIGEESQQC